MRLALKLSVAAFTGYLYGYCFPPDSIHLLAWVVFIPLCLIVRTSTLGVAAGAAALFSMAGMCATVDWLPQTVANYYDQPLLIGAALFAAVMFLMVAPWVGAFGAAYKVAAHRPSALRPLYAGAAWTAAEFARANLLTGNPWVLLGYSQLDVIPLLQIADITGVYGLSFAIVTANAALAESWLSRRGGLKAAIAGAAFAASIVAAVLAYGQWRLRAEGHLADLPATEVVLVQGNVDLGAQWRTELYGQTLDVYLRLTTEALRQAPAPLVVWPENAMTFFVDREPLYRAAIARTLQHWNAQLIAGGPHHDGGNQPRFYNSAFLVEADGTIRGRYDKEKLLPFAEYFPFAGSELLRRSFGRVREFTPGAPTSPLPSVAGAAGVLICNEAMFPEVARRRVAAGATYLVNLTNDTWVGDRKFSEIMFDTSILRAVETRRYLLRVSTSGPSAVVDPFGRVTTITPLFESTTTRGVIRPSDEQTIYARAGDVFAWLCVAFAVLGVVLGRTRERPPRRSSA